MKRLIWISALILVLSLVVAGCSKEDAQNEDPAKPAEGSDQPAKVEKGYEFSYKGTSIAINSKAAEVLAAIGKENSYFEAESCAYQGMDKIYTYNGFELKTNEIEGEDYITSILLLDDSNSTPEGVTLYMTKDDMVKAYGNDYNEELGLYTYQKGVMKITFLVKNDEITSIEYLALIKK